jgi:hypothetical protein
MITEQDGQTERRRDEDLHPFDEDISVERTSDTLHAALASAGGAPLFAKQASLVQPLANAPTTPRA